jgi:hypothetical protein
MNIQIAIAIFHRKRFFVSNDTYNNRSFEADPEIAWDTLDVMAVVNRGGAARPDVP